MYQRLSFLFLCEGQEMMEYNRTYTYNGCSKTDTFRVVCGLNYACRCLIHKNKIYGYEQKVLKRHTSKSLQGTPNSSVSERKLFWVLSEFF
jgi:hypothetical protein